MKVQHFKSEIAQPMVGDFLFVYLSVPTGFEPAERNPVQNL